MTRHRTGRLIILSGPSCVGKTPLTRALRKVDPDSMKLLQDIVLYNTRSPRPGEADGVDYRFRKPEEVDRLREDSRYVVMDVRGDLQALDLEDLSSLLKKGDAFYEGNPFIARRLQTHESLKDVSRLGIFVSPLSREEILTLREQPGVSLSALVADIMRRKLLRRMIRQKGELSLPGLEEVERRCASAYRELQNAHHFDHVMPNHDGEDSENWDAFPLPLGDARSTTLAVAAILRGNLPATAEKWEDDLLP